MVSKYFKVSRTLECSNFVVIICLPRLGNASIVPSIARLLDSLAPLVNITSLGFTFNKSAIVSVALSSNNLDSIPNLCIELALPGNSLTTLLKLFNTSLSTNVVAE